MARWKELTYNQKRQMKSQIEHRINRIGFTPRTKRKLSRNNKNKGE